MLLARIAPMPGLGEGPMGDARGIIEAERRADLGPLAERGWLAGQPPEFRDWVAGAGRWRIYEPRQVLYDAGEMAEGLFGLAEGALEVTLPLVGDEPVTLYRAEPGFWIGDSALLAEEARLVSVSAAARSRVLRIPGPAIRDLLAAQPGCWQAFYNLSHINMATLLNLLAEALSLTPTARLARVIARLSEADGTIAASQSDLARLLGVTRSTLQRALAELVAIGAVRTGYRSLMVRDAAALARATRGS